MRSQSYKRNFQEAIGIKLRHDAVKFIFDRGDEVTHLHLLQSLGMLDTKTGKE